MLLFLPHIHFPSLLSNYADSCIIGIWLRHLAFLHVKSHSFCTGDLFLFYTKSLATKFIHTRCWEVKTCKFKSLLQHIKCLGIFLSFELKMWKFLNIFKLVDIHSIGWVSMDTYIYGKSLIHYTSKLGYFVSRKTFFFFLSL